MDAGKTLSGNILFNGAKLQDFVSTSINTQPRIVYNGQGASVANTSLIYRRMVERFGTNNPVAKLPTEK
jgi:phosphoheptose isomerase